MAVSKVFKYGSKGMRTRRIRVLRNQTKFAQQQRAYDKAGVYNTQDVGLGTLTRNKKISDAKRNLWKSPAFQSKGKFTYDPNVQRIAATEARMLKQVVTRPTAVDQKFIRAAVGQTRKVYKLNNAIDGGLTVGIMGLGWTAGRKIKASMANRAKAKKVSI